MAAYVASLRLQNLDTLDRDRLKTLAERFAKPKLRQAADAIAALVEMEGVLEPL